MKTKGRLIIFLTGEQCLGLVLLVLLTVGGLVLVKHLQPPKVTEDTWVNDSTKTQFAAYQVEQDSLRKAAWKQQYRRDTIAIRMQDFDPNTADSATLVHLGFKPWQAKNMLKYRAAGGKYRKAEDVKNIYGVSDSMYLALTPYIRIARDSVDSTAVDSLRRDTVLRWVSIKKDTVINLRTADTTALKMIRGIGSYRARQIVRYREQLGGFVCVEQLMEVPGMEELCVDSILSHFIVDSVKVQQMSINRVSVQRLSRHPYLRFEEAQAIYELRRKKIRLDSIEQLQELDCISSETLKKLAPYINFDKK